MSGLVLAFFVGSAAVGMVVGGISLLVQTFWWRGILFIVVGGLMLEFARRQSVAR